MKFIHTSDWHLGQSFYNFSKEKEHRAFFNQLEEIVSQERPDALLVSGDIFHIAVPSSQAQRLFVEGVLQIQRGCPSMKIIITAGNHDSFSLLESHRDLWKTANVTIVGYPEYAHDGDEVLAQKLITEITDEIGNLKGYIITVPYIRPSRYYIFSQLIKKVSESNHNNLPIVVMAHLNVNGSTKFGQDNLIGGIDGIDCSEFGDEYDYLALGHIHTPQFIKGTNNKARYSGTPIQTSFDEQFPHSVSLVELKKHHEPPCVTEIEIKNPNKYITFPKEPKTFDEIEKNLKYFDEETEGFLRLNVLVENSLPIDAETRIYEILKEKRLKLCQILTHIPNMDKENDSMNFDVQKFKESNPLEIAKLFYKNKYGSEMPIELQKLFNDVQHEINEEA